MRNSMEIALATVIKIAMTAVGLYGCCLAFRLAKWMLLTVVFCAVLFAGVTPLVNVVAGSANNNNVTTGAINTTGAGLLVVAMSNSTAGTSTLSDSKGNTWNALTAKSHAGTCKEQFYYATNPPIVGTGHTFSATGTGTSPALSVSAWAGIATPVLDQQNGAIQGSSGPTLATGTITPTVANELWLSAFCSPDITSSFTAATGTIINSLTASALTFGIATSYKIQTTIQTEGETWTYGVSGFPAAVIASFKFSNVPIFGAPVTLPKIPLVLPTSTSTFQYPVNSGGDTQFPTWTSAATRAGSWGGGSIVGSYNDGSGFGCGSSSICLYEYLTYNPASQSGATFGLVNTMTSYGSSSVSSCYDTVNQMKSRKPFAFNGAIFLPIFCMGAGPSFNGFQSGFIVSPNGGANWCNYKSFNAHTTSPDCDSSNWHATGDNPVDASGFQWPLATIANKMTRMQIVDFLCQDNSIGCPVPTGVDPAYLYFMTILGDGSAQYVLRIPKSGGWKGVMSLTGAAVYNAGVWDAVFQNATNISSPVPVGCCGSIAYLADFGVFAVWNHSSSVTMPFATATTPWGTWTQNANVTFPTASGFPSPVAGLCPRYSGGVVKCTVESSPNTQLNLVEFTLGTQKPVWGGVQ
jgi:hypothetical protein